MGHMYLVIVDAHSKWMNVEVMPQITAEKTIQKLRSVFSTHGVPQKIVTDNGPTFRSEQFQAFTKEMASGTYFQHRINHPQMV